MNSDYGFREMNAGNIIIKGTLNKHQLTMTLHIIWKFISDMFKNIIYMMIVCKF